jgi:hypothetical protein
VGSRPRHCTRRRAAGELSVGVHFLRKMSWMIPDLSIPVSRVCCCRLA